jgi:hypothetical protein
MGKLSELKNKLQTQWANTESSRGKVAEGFEKVGYVLLVIWKWIYNLRSIFLAVPVVIAAIRLAILNLNRLPDSVGLMLMPSGEYQWMVEKGMAVMGPIALTAACLFLMFISRRVVYPWLISVFSLTVPLLIYITNIFPA